MTPGKVILLNGPSSAGKSTLAVALQAALPEPFLRFGFDFFLIPPILPLERVRNGELSWREMRPHVINGFHRCLPALAWAGNNLLVDHIIEPPAGKAPLLAALEGLDVFFVGVHCPIEELERREAARGDRRVGEARQDLETVHSFERYDFEVDSSLPLEGNVSAMIEAWQRRQGTSAFFNP